ncbi:MAG: tetratricopeptide repeat protein [Dehalococcoidia bacterium]
MQGELAPKLALGYAYELSGDLDHALHCYDLVSRSDPTFTSAAFGVARCLERRGDRGGAAEAYARVPGASSRHPRAQMRLAQVLLISEPDPPGEAELARASVAIEGSARRTRRPRAASGLRPTASGRRRPG